MSLRHFVFNQVKSVAEVFGVSVSLYAAALCWDQARLQFSQTLAELRLRFLWGAFGLLRSGWAP